MVNGEGIQGPMVIMISGRSPNSKDIMFERAKEDKTISRFLKVSDGKGTTHDLVTLRFFSSISLLQNLVLRLLGTFPEG